MSEVQHWTCPYCNRAATLQAQDRILGGKHLITQDPADGHKHLSWYYVVCPSPTCKKFTLRLALSELSWDVASREWHVGDLERTWDLVPPSSAQAFPNYIPRAILDDYDEACLIVNLSPKASATLSRRCLQGILRDYWRVTPTRLVDEIDQIKDKTDPLTWDAIDSVRKVGNIGAHMENDINVIVDVDPQEAQMLIELIEILLKDWYVAREARKKRLLSIKAIAVDKDAKRDSPA